MNFISGSTTMATKSKNVTVTPMNLQQLPTVDASWTLFLDRDGVINERIDNDYVRNWDDFSFFPRTPQAIASLSEIFGKVIVVTNQQGIGKGLMTEKELNEVHRLLRKTIDLMDGRIDKIYHCPDLAASNSPNRKPNTGMGLQAKQDFPMIDFKKSIMVGDSASDIEFGKRLGMTTILIKGKPSIHEADCQPDFIFESLTKLSKEFCIAVQEVAQDDETEVEMD
jgi:D-glycero-D-manno-heptose 1,7-bisphosphate phosphatase